MPDDDDVLTTADRLWRGETRTTRRPSWPRSLGSGRGWPRSPTASRSCPPSPTSPRSTPTTASCSSTPAAPSSPARCTRALRSWTTSRLHTAVYSHGHVDHVFGVPVWEEEAESRGWSRPGGRRPRSTPRPFRPLRDDRRLQRGDQPAAVRARLARMADRVPLPGPHLPRPPRPRRRRSHRAAPPRSRRDRRPHLDLVPRAPGALLRRPVHLGVTECRQPPEGPALPARVGRRPPPDARPLRRARKGAPRCCSPGTAIRSSASSGSARRSTTRPTLLESLVRQTLALMNGGAAPRRGDPHGAAACGPDRAALPPAGLRRARVHRAHRLAPLRRLVGRQPGHPCSPRPERALARELAELAGGAGVLAERALALLEGASAVATPATATPRSGSRDTSPSSPGWPKRATRRSPRPAGASSPRAADAASSTMAHGVFSWAARES